MSQLITPELQENPKSDSVLGEAQVLQFRRARSNMSSDIVNYYGSRPSTETLTPLGQNSQSLAHKKNFFRNKVSDIPD